MKKRNDLEYSVREGESEMKARGYARGALVDQDPEIQIKPSDDRREEGSGIK